MKSCVPVLFAFLLAVVAAGCSSDAMTVVLPDLPPCPGPDCNCSDGDNNCTCESRSECALECGDGCRFDCEEDSTCASAAGNDANLECVEDTTCTLYAGANSTVRCTAANCTVEVGDGSSVSCRDRGRCEVTCTGSCNISCEGDSTRCLYRCSAEDELSDGPGSCP